MAFILKDSQQADLSVTVLSRAGNPAPVDNPKWESDNPDVVAVEAADGTNARVVAVGPVGTATVTFTADGDLGDGVKELKGVLDVEVVGGDAAVLNITPSAPVEKPEAAPDAPAPTENEVADAPASPDPADGGVDAPAEPAPAPVEEAPAPVDEPAPAPVEDAPPPAGEPVPADPAVVDEAAAANPPVETPDVPEEQPTVGTGDDGGAVDESVVVTDEPV
jgi:hypothetical protein